MKLHRLQGYIQHIYLAEFSHALVLLDGCSRADVDTVLRYIRDTLKRRADDLKLIVVTHMHPDHAGGAHRLRAMTGARIACHPKAPVWYAGLAGRTAHLIDVMLTWYVASRLGQPKRHIWYSPLLKPDVILDDNQTLPGFADWRVLYTPGHTDHDISLLYQPDNSVYVADLMVKVKGEMVPPYPLCHPNQYRRSLKRVAALSADTVYFAHIQPKKGADIGFDDVLARAPEKPKNHWYASKSRLGQLFGRFKSQF